MARSDINSGCPVSPGGLKVSPPPTVKLVLPEKKPFRKAVLPEDNSQLWRPHGVGGQRLIHLKKEVDLFSRIT
jgi:hypothetical protein